MCIAGLILGILSVTVAFWAAPSIGTLWSAALAFSGTSAPPAWPIWLMGLGIGAGLPLIGILLSIIGIVKKQSKGIGIAGIVICAIGLILSIIFTSGAAVAVDIAGNAAANILGESSEDMQKLQDALNSPDLQERIRKAMEAAQKAPEDETQQQNALSEDKAPPKVLMPGQAAEAANEDPVKPVAPASAEQPAEAPAQ